MKARDYSLRGEGTKHAIEAGLVAANWYHSDVPRPQMKELMRRSDSQAIKDTILLYGCMIALASMGLYLWPTWWSAPCWLAYGVLYGSASDSRWHECGHGTAFKTRWMNDLVYEIASFMIMRNSVVWRWSHARHHTDTYIVGHDPEIAIMRPPKIWSLVLKFFGLSDIKQYLISMLRQAFVGLNAEESCYVPNDQIPKVVLVARISSVIYGATLALSVYNASILPLMFIGLPRLYGAWHHIMTGLLQHGGLAENVLDHRLNSRTVYMNPISGFIYWNMNYHVEHHMFPMVPYHALPKLHAMIGNDLPPANKSIYAAFAEMVPAIWRQRSDPDYYLRRELPESAKPYRIDLHEGALGRLPDLVTK